MTIPEWNEDIDDHGIHREIEDKTLSEALPHEKADSIDGYHEKYVKESKGKLVVQGKDKKMRRTPLGEGLFKDQQRLKDAVRKFNGARRMKRVAGTKARVGFRNSLMYPIADGPSPQNINPVRRTVTTEDLGNDLRRIEVPAHVMRPTQNGERFLATVSDGDEPTNDPSEKHRTLCFVTHGCVNLSCEAVQRDAMRIGDDIFVSTTKTDFGTNSTQPEHPKQYKIVSHAGATVKRIGRYLGPSSKRPNGGIIVELDLNH